MACNDRVREENYPPGPVTEFMFRQNRESNITVCSFLIKAINTYFNFPVLILNMYIAATVSLWMQVAGLWYYSMNVWTLTSNSVNFCCSVLLFDTSTLARLRLGHWNSTAASSKWQDVYSFEYHTTWDWHKVLYSKLVISSVKWKLSYSLNHSNIFGPKFLGNQRGMHSSGNG